MKASNWITLVFGWRFILTLAAIIAPLLLPFKPTFPYSETLARYGPKVIHSWANFDGVHYLTVIEKGYVGTASIQAFFPLYPLLIRSISWADNPVIIGQSISTVALIVALYFLHKLTRLDFSQTIAYRTIIVTLLFPTAFFFTALYTESLFLLLTVLAFYQARKARFVTAGLFAALASATRITGILIFPALLIEWHFWQKSVKPSILIKIKTLASLTISTTGLLAYMTYLKTTFNDALYFFTVQSQFGVGRETQSITVLPQVFWRYLKMIFTVDPSSYLYYSVWFESIAALVFLGLIILAFKKTRLSYAVYALISYLVPTLTGTFTSMPRYVLVLFPAFIVLAQLLSGKKYLAYLTISGILLIINTILFIQGYWIA